VYDLYCGTGSIGIFVSGLAKKVVGVEMVEEAIEDAIENAV
jgi:23S rRNA (uracil1939-C5)-methyltransferase